MASAVKKISVENDSVIYEHIIPRSVRQKWMRKASIEHLDLIITSPRERTKSKQSDKFAETPTKSKESENKNDYGDSIVSHDVQCMNNDDGSGPEYLITPEEEKAVFNAFGVKLRHTGIHYTAKKRPPSLNGEIESSTLSETQTQTKHLEEKQPFKNDHSNPSVNESKASVQLRNTSRRPRPMSMPVMTEEVEKSYQILVENSSLNKSKPKAYISPHAKVPWKRNIAARLGELKGVDKINGEKMFDKTLKQKNDGLDRENRSLNNEKSPHEYNDEKSVRNETNQVTIRHQKDDQTYLQNSIIASSTERFGEKIDDRKLTQNEDKTNVLQSVFERRKSFEKSIVSNEARKYGCLNKSVVSAKNAHQSYEKPDKKKVLWKNENSVFKDQSISKEKNAANKMINGDSNNMNREKKPGPNTIVDENTDQELKAVPKNQKPKEENISFSENSHNKLLNIFQSMPVYKPDHDGDQNSSVANDKQKLKIENMNSEKVQVSNKDSSEIDQNIVLKVRENFEKKIKKMTIQTGEQREKEMKSKQRKTLEKAVENKSKDNISHEPVLNVNKLKKIENNVDVPVTNLDETMPESSENQQNHHPNNIPITNIDEMPSSTLIKPDNKVPGIKNYEIVPAKKPGKYDADRRALVAPKVFFEKPVTGLVSVLSPKGKKSGKKKNRVSFVSADLATVHTYPSESAAIAMYEESHNEGSCVGGDNEKNIDDVIADKSSSGDFHSYMPTSFADLTGTLERERNIIAKQNNKMGTEEETKTASEQSDKSPGFGSSGSLFTESSTGELNAILF